ncbi:MAG: type IV pilus biogenesis protein PilP, partial [Rhodobacteraceae bacterium]|nr:type IV pilus biogenesis protein PilP [Paracoccaceae bacterium]
AARTKDGDTKATGVTPKSAFGTSKPSSSPTATTVAKAATEKGRFNKRQMSLVGVFGTSNARRALVRMPSGRYVKVKTGDRLSGWKVSAIGESSVRIIKGSKNQILRMP